MLGDGSTASTGSHGGVSRSSAPGRACHSNTFSAGASIRVRRTKISVMMIRSPSQRVAALGKVWHGYAFARATAVVGHGDWNEVPMARLVNQVGAGGEVHHLARRCARERAVDRRGRIGGAGIVG